MGIMTIYAADQDMPALRDAVADTNIKTVVLDGTGTGERVVARAEEKYDQRDRPGSRATRWSELPVEERANLTLAEQSE